MLSNLAVTWAMPVVNMSVKVHCQHKGADVLPQSHIRVYKYDLDNYLFCYDFFMFLLFEGLQPGLFDLPPTKNGGMA